MVPLRRARDAIIELLDHNDNTDNRVCPQRETKVELTIVLGLFLYRYPHIWPREHVGYRW